MQYTDDPIAGMKKRSDLIGKKFGRLTVVDFSHTNKHKQSMWKCKCECGKEIIATGIHLSNGHTKSCGCLKKDVLQSRKTHGMRNTRLYRIWLGMKSRCTIKTTTSFRHYGGRGITICDEWMNDFQSFYDWAMANGYSENLTIDRIDPNGNYEPSNCRWVTTKVQANNKRTNAKILFNGETKTIKEVSEISGINYQTLFSRYKAGKSLNEIVSKKGAV